jgi:hypothetical protein
MIPISIAPKEAPRANMSVFCPGHQAILILSSSDFHDTPFCHGIALIEAIPPEKLLLCPFRVQLTGIFNIFDSGA